MNKYLRELAMATAVLLATVPAQAARMGGDHAGGFGHRGGGFSHPGSFHGGGFEGRRFYRGHDRFFFGFGFGYPAYSYSYPNYYYAPYYYPYDYYYSPRYYYVPSYSYNIAPYSAPVTAQTYLVVGHDWGKDLRLNIVTWDQLVTYVRAYVMNAPAGAQDDFRRGFLSGYGDKAEDVFNRALRQAKQPPPPSPPNSTTSTNAPSPGASNAGK